MTNINPTREAIAGAIALGIRDNEHPRIIADTILGLIAADRPDPAPSPGPGSVKCNDCNWTAVAGEKPLEQLDMHRFTTHLADELHQMVRKAMR